MKAVSYYLVVDKIKEKPKSTSGFIMTESQSEDIRYLKGEVISVGENISTVKEGDIVWYDKHAGHGIEFNDKYYYVIKYSDVVILE
jgi:co-chaperonin GroES (HSP10)